MQLIVYVHGALSTRKSFSFIKSKLKHNSGNVKDFAYDIRKLEAEQIVSNLTEAVSRELGLKPYNNVTFICHSFGGVISTAAVRRLYSEGCTVPCEIISMATPYGGSGMAALMLLMKPGSIFLKNTSAYNSFMRGFKSQSLPCPVYGIVTTEGSADVINEPNDSVVTIESQLHFQKDPYWVGLNVGYNHFEVLLSDEVTDHIKRVL